MSEIIVDTLKHSGNNSTANVTLASNGNVSVAGALSAGSFTGAGILLKKSYFEIPRASYTNALFPDDDTTPQRTEGAEAFSQAYTPSTGSCDLYITAFMYAGEASNISNSISGGLFISDNLDCLQVISSFTEGSGSGTHGNAILHWQYKMASWGTTEKTFSLRTHGANCINYVHNDGDYSEAKWGATATKTSFVIEEIST